MSYRLPETYYVIGVMSGTSLDGVDLVYIAFEKEMSWKYEIKIAQTIPYDPIWTQRLRKGIYLDLDNLKLLDEDYTTYLGEIILKFIKRHGIQYLDAVCSHGHTIKHQPHLGYTLQIGNLPKLAKLLAWRVVCDFRIQDVALGGQGAPLVPIGDQILFGENDYCINIGGFANISFESNHKRVAYDICPANIVLNHYAQKLGLPYDKGGAIAAVNEIDTKLLDSLNALAFYEEAFPKSLGLEWVEENIFPLINARGLNHEVIIATFSEHIAQQLAKSLNSNEHQQKGSALITGGGAYNKHIISRLEELTKIKIIVPDALLVEFKEALIFGFMGVLRLRNTTNVLASVTGAKKDHCSGIILLP